MTLILNGTDNSVSSPAVQGGTAGTTTGVYYPTTNQLALATNGTQAVLIDGSQNVGIGMTPTYKLDVTGSIRTSGVAYVTGGDGSIQRSGGNTWIMVSSNTGYGSNGVHLKLDSSTTAGFFGFYSQGTSILEAAGAGNTVVLQGGSTSAGTGIAFPATQNASANANTLDDYEEGTWTPSIGGNATYTTQVGQYTKIGRLVVVIANLNINVKGTGSNNLITGMPFTQTGSLGIISIGYYAGSATSYSSVYGYMNGSTISITATTAGGSASTTDPAVFFANSTQVYFTCSYFTST